MQKFLAKLLIRLLNSNRLTQDTKSIIITGLIEKIEGMPIMDTVKIDNSRNLYVNGKMLTGEEAETFRQNSHVVYNSFVMNAIDNQLIYEATKYGVHTAVNNEMLLFSKAIIWVIQERKKILSKILS